MRLDRPNVLLTTVCRPFGGIGEGDTVGAELFHAQVTRSQGIFSYRQVIRCWGLDYIAENIDAPCVSHINDHRLSRSGPIAGDERFQDACGVRLPRQGR